MNAVMSVEPGIGAGLKKIETGKLVLYGLLVMLAHLTMLLVNRFVTFSLIKSHIPAAFSSGYTLSFYTGAVGTVFLELMIFVLGWMFISGMANLLDGQSNARPLFGALALCYLPVLFYSLLTFIAFLTHRGDINTAAIAQATQPEQLAAAISTSFSGAIFQALKRGEPFVYGLSVLMMIEAVRRVCQLSRFKAVLAVGAFIGLLFLVNRFAN
jgi:hypothetical protein